jgi:hypothetical protein
LASLSKGRSTLALFERDRSNKGKRAAKAAREKTLIDGISRRDDKAK